MRTFKSTLLLMFILCFSIVSCDNEPLEGTFTDEIGTGSNTGSGSTTGNTSFFAKVDGVEFAEQNLMGTKASGMLAIMASRTDGTQIVISMPDTVTPGTYNFDLATYVGQYSKTSPSVMVTRADSGSVTISSHDTANKKVVGTFNFVSSPIGATTPQHNVSDGSFSVTY